MYLLDTDVLSNLMKRAPADALVARLARVPPEDQFTSSVTLGELLYGAHRSSRAAALLERIEETLLAEVPVLPFDAAAARRYGELRAELDSATMPAASDTIRRRKDPPGSRRTAPLAPRLGHTTAHGDPQPNHRLRPQPDSRLRERSHAVDYCVTI
jgi:tRNA(fMet)-specific endonuclease VapC